jgi:hypothetical protein
MQKKMNGNQYGKYKNKQYAQKKNERGEHVATYCHQEDDECEDYSECMGNCYTGSCFKKPIKKFFGINASSFSGSYYLKF